MSKSVELRTHKDGLYQGGQNGTTSRAAPDAPRKTGPDAARAVPAGNKRPRLGLALGGGALRGSAHVGALHALQRAGIEFDLVAGTSVGSLVAAFYAAGMQALEIADLAESLTKDVLYDAAVSPFRMLLLSPKVTKGLFGQPGDGRGIPNGIAAGVRLEAWVREHMPVDRFDELPRPYACVATDLRSAETVLFATPGQVTRPVPPKTTLLDQGVSIASAVRASCALPTFYPPKRIAGRILSDGGIVQPVPAEALRLMGADIVLAVDLGTGGPESQEPEGLTRIFNRSIAIGTQMLTDAQLALHADLVVKPQLYNTPMDDLSALPGFIAEGRRAMEESLPDLFRVINQWHERPQPTETSSAGRT